MFNIYYIYDKKHATCVLEYDENRIGISLKSVILRGPINFVVPTGTIECGKRYFGFCDVEILLLCQ